MLTREAKLEKTEDGLFSLSFSSETPYERWFGMEILDHSEGALDYTRLSELGTVLYNHDRDEVIGKVESVSVEEGRGVATISFDDDEKSQRIKSKVERGSLKGVSVGYKVNVWEDVEAGQTSTCGRFQGPCSIARKWEAFEISIVSVPADATVGVGRSAEEDGNQPQSQRQEINEGGNSKMSKENIAVMAENPETAVVEKSTTEIETKDYSAQIEAAKAAERERATEVEALCRDFEMDSTEFIKSGASVDAVRKAILDEMIKTGSAVSAKAETTVTADEADKFRSAVVDGLMLKAGVADNKTDGSNSYRAMSLRDLAIECLSREGRSANELIRMDGDTLYQELCRQAFNPSAAFPAIMDQTINKSIVNLYNEVPTTFQAWTATGTLSDFKTTSDHEYVIGGLRDFELVPENGEIKNDVPSTELLPQRKLDTYGKQFSMTRQAFINDDIGFLTQVPGLYAAKAKKTIDKQVYSILVSNPAIFDGVNLFNSAHKNLITSGAAPSQQTIQEIILAMQKQVDQFGDPIYMTPQFLIVPVGYGFDLKVIFNSAQVTGSGNNDINPLYNYPLQVVETPMLNALAGSGAVPWFITAAPSSARHIQVDYLNGNQTPIVRRMETPGVLGFVWDIYMDWGVAVRDFRGIYKNPGATIS